MKQTGAVSNMFTDRRLIVSDVQYRMVRTLESINKITSPASVAEFFGPKLKDLVHEEFWVLCLSSSNRAVGAVRITSGTLNSSLAHPRECFRTAILLSAASVVFVHNHPSGNAEPSQEDVALTRQLVEAGKILGIPVHDHIVIAGEHHVSLAERNLL